MSITQPTLQQFQYSMEKGVVTHWANIAVGATGAPTLPSAKENQGITSVTRVSAGRYQVNLGPAYQRLMSAQSAILLATGAPSTTTNTQMMVRADNSATSSPNVVVEFINSAGTAVDLVSGSVILLEMKFKRSTI